MHSLSWNSGCDCTVLSCETIWNIALNRKSSYTTLLKHKPWRNVRESSVQNFHKAQCLPMHECTEVIKFHAMGSVSHKTKTRKRSTSQTKTCIHWCCPTKFSLGPFRVELLKFWAHKMRASAHHTFNYERDAALCAEVPRRQPVSTGMTMRKSYGSQKQDTNLPAN
jgi:hypothetical protein